MAREPLTDAQILADYIEDCGLEPEFAEYGAKCFAFKMYALRRRVCDVADRLIDEADRLLGFK